VARPGALQEGPGKVWILFGSSASNLWVKSGVEVRVDDSICGQTLPRRLGETLRSRPASVEPKEVTQFLSATGDSVTLRSQIFGQILFHLSRCLERHRI